jgi:TolA-binding protein
MSAVLFWIGSAQYATKDYKSAVTTFESLLAAFPDNPRAADALLSVGFSQVEGGDRKTGRKTLETVGTRYPGTQAAQLARERLSTLK